MNNFFGPKKLTVLFNYSICCWYTHKKSALKSKDFFTLCAYPSLVKKDILWTLSVPCYCHVGEELPGQPLQKAGHFNVQAASDGTT